MEVPTMKHFYRERDFWLVAVGFLFGAAITIVVMV
jgi:hypothetical protein